MQGRARGDGGWGETFGALQLCPMAFVPSFEGNVHASLGLHVQEAAREIAEMVVLFSVTSVLVGQ